MARAFLINGAMEFEDRRAVNIRTRRIRSNLRAQARPLELSDTEFIAHYRLTKDIFEDLCNELEPLLPAARRKTKISVACKVLTALSFYATGSYQKPVGMNYLHGLSQTSVSRAVKEVTIALNNPRILKKFIRFPQTPEERRAVVSGFFDKFGFPGVLGCIDGTHVALVRPTDHEERFFNRKHYHSRNVQIVCDSDLNITHIDATYGGATHDAHIWRNSEIYGYMRHLHQTGESVWFLGDSGYPLRPWILTPITNAEPGSAERYYTNAHCRARNCVERTIGVLKARWRCLLVHRVLHYNDKVVAQIINACAVLHNICNKNRLPLPEMPLMQVERGLNLQVAVIPIDNDDQLESGRRQRNLIVQQLWMNR